MPLRCPALIIHHQAGKEYWAEQEVGDILFPYDINVSIERTPYRGVLLVYTKVDPSRAYRLVENEILTSIDKVIPVSDCYLLEEPDEIPKFIEKFVKAILNGDCVNLLISLRGSLKHLEKTVISIVRKYLSTYRKCRSILYIESIDKLLLIGFVEDSAGNGAAAGS
ncbi:MAG: hypothetical protein F7B60_02185 [Desulfurococcales archaeon]|nr:hypothetical protein [Desulfurococcales archaeon]